MPNFGLPIEQTEDIVIEMQDTEKQGRQQDLIFVLLHFRIYINMMSKFEA